MRIGVAKEIKQDEHRVALTPAGARRAHAAGHEVVVETGRRRGQRAPRRRLRGRRRADRDRRRRLGELRDRPQGEGAAAAEYGRLREGLILFTYLHLAADEALTRALLDSGATCIAYETVETDDGKLPLLAPMSEVAGRLATQMGAWALEKAQGGRGILLGGVPGVPPAKVVVLGGGIVGYNAALIAVGMQADVWVLDKSVERMRDLEMMLDGRITLAMSNRLEIDEAVADADLIIGAVLIPGARAPKLITREMLPALKPGAVLVDVAIDQGGCFETSRPTTHSDPDLRRRRDRPLLRREHARRGADHVDLRAHERDAALRRADRRPRRARGHRPRAARSRAASTSSTGSSPTRPSPRRTASSTRRSTRSFRSSRSSAPEATPRSISGLLSSRSGVSLTTAT